MGKKTTVFVFSVLIFAYIFGLYVPRTSAAIDCLTITSTSDQSTKDYCKKELAKIEAELQDLLNKQKEQQKQTGTLKGDVNYLNSQINALKTKIKARSLAITQLKINITEKVKTINSLSSKIDREYESLAQLLRNTNEFDNENLVHLILSDSSVSNFYSDLESYASIKAAVKDSVDVIRGVKNDTELAKQDLEAKQDAETDAKAELESAQRNVAKSEADKKELLSISQQKEAEYLALAAQKKAQADKIRAALFPLANTTTKIDFGTALQYAEEAQKKTGIEPAFLLAVLTKESSLGANVGQCYLTDIQGIKAGYGINKNTGTVWSNLMKPTRDVQPFLNITSRLGLNPLSTPVSCPAPGVIGYGGAMGPAQFIPSTWEMFRDRLKTILGYNANPWSPRDAFTASALYLTDLGAVGNSYANQSRAACSYYGTRGSTCYYSSNGSGTGVMNLKAGIQANIDLLSG